MVENSQVLTHSHGSAHARVRLWAYTHGVLAVHAMLDDMARAGFTR